MSEHTAESPGQKDERRPDGSKTFGERACQCGGMGRLPIRPLLPIALAPALKPAKSGA